MKLSQMNATQIEEIASLAQLKPSLLKPAFVGDLEIEMIDGKPLVGESNLRDHIAHNSDVLDDISAIPSNEISQGRYDHVLNHQGAKK